MDFPLNIITAAQKAKAKYGGFVSVALAQYALESNWGKSMSGKNNPFGIKAIVSQPATVKTTHEVINGKTITIQARFADYESMDDAFEHHAKLLATGSAYGAARAAKTADGFANALTGHYATDPNYGSKLISIMKAHNLYQYDSGVTTVTVTVTTKPSTEPVNKPKAAATAVVVAGGTAAVVASNYSVTAFVIALAVAAVGVAAFCYFHFKKKS